MKNFISLPALILLFMSANALGNIDGFDNKIIKEQGSLRFQELLINNKIDDYVISITSENKQARFMWTCSMKPFFYPPELSKLTETQSYEITIAINENALSINHYIVQSNGVLLSKSYMTTHFPTLLNEITQGKDMVITIDGLDSKPKYTFKNYKLLPILQEFVDYCDAID